MEKQEVERIVLWFYPSRCISSSSNTCGGGGSKGVRRVTVVDSEVILVSVRLTHTPIVLVGS